MKTILSFLSPAGHFIARSAFIRPRSGFIALALAFAGCSSDDDPAPDPTDPVVEASLSVAPTDITASQSIGTYALAVTSNVAWAAAVDAADTWCTLVGAPVTGNGNGTVTVNVAENTTTATRTATVTFAAGTLTQQVPVEQAAADVPPPDDATPPLAASTRTWTFDTQMWSDAIHVPECNKTDFNTSSDTESNCRNHTSGGRTFYYYNWSYLNAHKVTMCPDPWRVPSREDIAALVDAVNANANATVVINNEWGFGGEVSPGDDRVPYNSDILYESEDGRYWSSTLSGDQAYSLYYYEYGDGVRMSSSTSRVNLGHQIRCVK